MTKPYHISYTHDVMKIETIHIENYKMFQNIVEERFMAIFHYILLTRLLPRNVSSLVIPHEGKSDLERSIPRKLKEWREPDVHFVIMRDNDC